LRIQYREWLRFGRAQTFPACWLLVIVPFLNGQPDITKVLILTIFMWCAHILSFGHNTLMDFTQGYDQRDPSKSHFPLHRGVISIHVAHNVIHWGLCGLVIFAIVLSLLFSPNPLFSVISIFLWWVFGYAYNSGLSKECLLSFLPIAICFTAMGAWGWFLSHNTLDNLGWLLLAYFFITILFQISWSGHLKELELEERSNILVKMGAHIEVCVRKQRWFFPGISFIYGLILKLINVPILGALLLAENFNLTRAFWLAVMLVLSMLFLVKLIAPRRYVRSKELRNMSVMEILTIYTPIPLVLPWLEATILMLFGVAYFWGMNKLLWGVVSHPRV